MPSSRLPIAAILMVLVLAACAQQAEPAATTPPDTEVAGTYSCAPEPPPDDPNWPGPETFELRGDGTLTITSPPEGGAQGTWSVEGDQVVLHIEGQDDRFNIEGDRLVGAGDPPPGEGAFTCTKNAD